MIRGKSVRNSCKVGMKRQLIFLHAFLLQEFCFMVLKKQFSFLSIFWYYNVAMEE